MATKTTAVARTAASTQVSRTMVPVMLSDLENVHDACPVLARNDEALATASAVGIDRPVRRLIGSRDDGWPPRLLR